MVKTKIEKQSHAELPKRAKKRIKRNGRMIKEAPTEEIFRLVHELEIHQVELELKNDELQRSRAELEDSRRKYFELYDLAPVGYVTLSRGGIIHEINLAGATLLGVNRARLKGRRLAEFVSVASRRSFHDFCRCLF
jgi:PAS domain-containing protein